MFKKLTITVLTIISLSGCNLTSMYDNAYKNVNDISNDLNNKWQYSNYDLYYNDDFNQIENPSDIGSFIAEHITYKSDTEDTLFSMDISSPKDTYENGYGDCEDYSLLFLNILYVRFGIQGSLIMYDARTIVNGGIVNHGIVQYNNIYVSAQSGKILTDIYVGFTYPMEDIFNL